ncbi:MAG: hypothetical protein HKN88_03180 [Gammaproteobacteria bacterium]|nr:hypothetical protein [Gammaproteobacteria bacterium]NNC97055.1 hypothetical protein [Gammaproteobacteria bacterium]NNM14349.1 hypothetical protein [Gammaproteobacteria bacterium]
MQNLNYTISKPFNGKGTQQGAVLIVSLFLLLALTVIVLSSARSSKMEVDMGVNSQIQTEAFADAEGSARAGEDKIEDEFQNGVLMITKNEEGFYNKSTPANTLNWDNIDYDWTALKTYKELKPGTSEVAREYMIEYRELLKKSLGGPNIDIHDRLIYRTSGIGNSSNDTKRIIHTFYATLLQPPAAPAAVVGP